MITMKEFLNLFPKNKPISEKELIKAVKKKMGYCETINCGYWYKDEEDSFPCCHYEDDDGCAPCEQEEEEE